MLISAFWCCRKIRQLQHNLPQVQTGYPFALPMDWTLILCGGDVYFTDASARLPNKAYFSHLGRLLKYDIKTKQVTVLLKGLSGPTGTAVGPDGMFVLVTEFIGKRIQKYWLKGPKANIAEVLITFKGRPDNIKRNRGGDFWVAVNQEIIIPLVMKPGGIRLDANGTVKESRLINLQYGT
ncbi:hypothetical protein Pint_16356 [Pistacia integerrima]|uniref:Uncharacterized protein n=1 Tax=Pistacia integerrima TaxID=434235 RepID=A0ACC0ZB24_9ROSI|nr:hypothetical protein Pint_16356 [Pistacia integerrima]